ncbi:MAG TPA: hypothetical protein VEJ63_01635 [Planctomycetota bacterium]|nr:hypothetical protein [Planctomycetota bacterium]
MQKLSTLSVRQAEDFLEHNYIVLEDCFTAETARDWVARAMARENIVMDDPRSYPAAFTFMKPAHTVEVRNFSPKAWGACCDLLGGPERIKQPYCWTDGFVVNFNLGAGQPWSPPDATRGSWHIDGDFNHFLDSPEIGLLLIIIWKDIPARGGGTYIAPDSIAPVARMMLNNPKGLSAVPFQKGVNRECRRFVAVEGRAGTVYVMHPFMLHTTSQNLAGTPRVIRNSAVALNEPMQLNRPNADDFSLVELGTLRALGVEHLDFKTPPDDMRFPTDHNTGERLPKRMLAPAMSINE